MLGINETTTQAEKQDTQDGFCFGGISGRWRYEDCRREHIFRRSASVWVKLTVCLAVCFTFGFIGTLGGILIYNFVQSHKSIYYPLSEQSVCSEDTCTVAPQATPSLLSVGGEASDLTVENVTAELSKRYRIPMGVMIKYIDDSSAPYESGIRQGDIIVKFNSSEVRDLDGLNSLRSQCADGDAIVVRIFRSNRYMDIAIVTAKEPQQ